MITENTYTNFLREIKQRIRSAQYEALKAVNKELIMLYWDIGKRIVEKQEELGWGKSVVEQLANDLQTEFPNVSGLSSRNLWRMKMFYQEYQAFEILPPLVAEIGWSHNVVVMEKCKDDFEREFYLRMTKLYGWTKAVLIHQIENHSYEKYLTNQTNFEQNLPEKYKKQAIFAVKDEYQFGFLELGEQHSEYELEQALMNNVRKFLIEMGGYFTFIGNQFRVQINDKEVFIDLLLYHRKLRSLVAIELKVGEFLPEYVGKMQFYLSVLNDKMRLEDENPSIGIIICKDKDRTFVEYALKDSHQPNGVATYTIESELPEKWKNLLPSPEEIKAQLDVLTKLTD